MSILKSTGENRSWSWSFFRRKNDRVGHAKQSTTHRHILYHAEEARTVADVCCEILDGEEICARCRHRNMDDEHACGSLSDCAEALAIMLTDVE